MFCPQALNTFIDDLFAFVIEMPTMHRLSCFRDDLVFFIFLYQKWIYRVDYTRANEFGYTPKTEEELQTIEGKKGEGSCVEQVLVGKPKGAAAEEEVEEEKEEKEGAAATSTLRQRQTEQKGSSVIDSID